MSTEITKKNYNEMTEDEKDVAAFESDLKRAEFNYRKTHGQLTDEEKARRRDAREWLGLPPDKDYE